MKYQYWLANIKGIGNATIAKILQSAGSAEEVYFLKKEQLEKIRGLTDKEVANILESKKKWDLDGAIVKLSDQGICFYSSEMENFPEILKNIHDAPYSIYVKGKLPDFSICRVAIVGARMCSEYGRAMAFELGKKLAANGVQVISGMAKGIDAYGHMGALEGGGATFAVLGCGVDICYPESNRKIYQKIPDAGGILSEYPPGQAPLAQLFPARNRIISALSDIVVVVEAKVRSGSLITADFALEQGRDIFAVPGRVTDALSGGCNNLIRQGAGILTSVDEFLKDLEISPIKGEFQENFNIFLLEKDESMVYSCLDLRPKNIEELIGQTGLAPQRVTDVLQRLLLKELITETFQNFYIRKF